MTWRYRVQGVIFALIVFGALVLAAAADWTDGSW